MCVSVCVCKFVCVCVCVCVCVRACVRARARVRVVGLQFNRRFFQSLLALAPCGCVHAGLTGLLGLSMICLMPVCTPFLIW